MENNISYDGGFKFKPNYKWPEKGNERNCPTDPTVPWQLNDDDPSYFGKPWWCYKCQFQFSEEDVMKGITCPNASKAQ